ncbi:RNA polymerase sigma factor [Amycolatopsis sp. cmx-11-12]|uniref:RNA polymerase sigma factor n=1 Tax=Amycolatopsis sp. cmx-11-12 TaxID=2785795 RepID=UPI0039185B17
MFDTKTIGAVHDRPDSELIEAVRDGSVTAYGELYERHVGAACNLARQLVRSATERDDLVSEAFSKLLRILRAGRGPDSAFRAYLLTTLRHTAYDKTYKDRKTQLCEDVADAADPALVSVPFNDTVSRHAEQALAAKAFAQLPERWQIVLWQTEVEGRPSVEVAPDLGLTPDGVYALAYRAREGLRQAYLQAHLEKVATMRCEPTIRVLGAWIRDGLPKRKGQDVEMHLNVCGSCRSLAAELAEINNGAFRRVVAGKSSCGNGADNRQPRQQSLTMEAGYSVICMRLAS